MLYLIHWQKYTGNSRKIVLGRPGFDISSILDFAMGVSFAAFSSWFSIKYDPIMFILFLLESWYMKI